MHPAAETIRRYGGLAATYELHSAGIDKHALANAVHRDAIVRVRQGWYCTPEVHPLLQQAVRVGGRLGCSSGAAMHGMWSVPVAKLHVTLDHNECRLRSANNHRRRLGKNPPGVTTHWTTRPRSGTRLLLDPISCLADVVRCHPIEFAVAIADSALRPNEHYAAPLVSHHEWQELIHTVPTRTHLLTLADGVCESGTESVAWVRLSAMHLPIQRQVWIDRKRVDFVIGRRLIVEIDGAAHHSTAERFEADRQRDAELCARDLRVLRFSYQQVIYRWHEVEAAIRAAVARGDHH